jgi:hypothetical protein
MATIYNLDVITSFNDTDQLYISQGEFEDKRIAVSAFVDSVEESLSVVTLDGDQEIDGVKTFTEAIVADVTGNLTGNADTVTNGVYTTGDQTIGGVKTFSAIPAFNGGESGVSAPMTVDSTDVVTNLNADKLDGADLSTDEALTDDSDALIPSQQAVKAYVDGKTAASAIIDIVYPVGCFYTQYPDADDNDLDVAFPSSKSPGTLFGGTWAKQWDTEGIDFHTERTSDTGLQTRTDGKQADQMQGHKHNVNCVTKDEVNPLNSGSYIKLSIHSSVDSGVPISDGSNGTPRTGTVTCDSNRLVRIWKRTE